ncbi:MAG TPA: RsmE family RNA methyltransferase [Bryobacteraceae bacterium]
MPHRRRFFVPEVRRGTAQLTGDDAAHLVRVLRAEVGQIYEISDNRDLYSAEIEVARKSLVSFRVLEKLPPEEAAVEIWLLAALIKFDRLEWLVEKATELGVGAIRPFEATRTERGLAQAAIKRRARWQKIALEASQQARRIHLPQVQRASSFAEALEVEANVKLLLDESADAPAILPSLPGERTTSDRVALLLGPEGGWTNEERAQAIAAGFQNCSLGRTILRSETAAVAGLAVIQAAWRADVPG